MIRIALAAALAVGAVAVPAEATREIPKIGACRLIPMQYPEVIDDAAGIVYEAAPPVRTAVYTACSL